jgi:hypothetical protein
MRAVDAFSAEQDRESIRLHHFADAALQRCQGIE